MNTWFSGDSPICRQSHHYAASTTREFHARTAVLKVNLRFFKPEVREQMIAAIRRIDNGIAITNGMPDNLMPEMTMKVGSTTPVNTPALIERLTKTLEVSLGPWAATGICDFDDVEVKFE
jgi:metal-dependent amidase/aminoacylase/carboxypeptidase family protein